MPRTTKTLIEEIIEVDASIIPNDAAMLPFITMANEIVTEVCTGAAGPTVAYSDDRLTLIETWLAAHFYTNRDPRAKSEGAGGVTASYESQIALGFGSSLFGQTAMRIDTNGGLAKLDADSKKGGKPRVGVSWLGTPHSEIPTE